MSAEPSTTLHSERVVCGTINRQSSAAVRLSSCSARVQSTARSSADASSSAASSPVARRRCAPSSSGGRSKLPTTSGLEPHSSASPFPGSDDAAFLSGRSLGRRRPMAPSSTHSLILGSGTGMFPPDAGILAMERDRSRLTPSRARLHMPQQFRVFRNAHICLLAARQRRHSVLRVRALDWNTAQYITVFKGHGQAPGRRARGWRTQHGVAAAGRPHLAVTQHLARGIAKRKGDRT
jgi:hypothetical protein